MTLAGTDVNDPHRRIHCDRGFALTKNATFLLYEPWTLLRIVPFRASSVRLDAEHDTNVILRVICRLCISWSCLIQWWLQSYSEYSHPINVKWCRKLRKNLSTFYDVFDAALPLTSLAFLFGLAGISRCIYCAPISSYLLLVASCCTRSLEYPSEIPRLACLLFLRVMCPLPLHLTDLFKVHALQPINFP